MRKKSIVSMVLVPMLSLLCYGAALAKPTYVTAFNTQYLAAYQTAHPGQAMTIANCTLCHPGGIPPALNSYGAAFLGSGHNFVTIAGLDSDGDTFSNLTEIMALPQTYPGNIASVPTPPADTTKPSVTGFAIPATSNSLVVPITAFTATDNVKVTKFKVTTTATAPLPGAAGWTITKPVNFSFPIPGVKTLYAWARDAAGNVSLSMSASTTITLTDAARPQVTAFAIPATSSTLVIPITTLTATDNVAVTGYKVTEKAAAPLAGATGWTAAKPANYTFLAASGAKTLYAWAKDAAGRVSLSMSAPVTVTRTDIVKPVVSAFTAVPAATANTATITVLTATDDVAVTLYKVTTTATAPLAGATGWTALPPASYRFPAAGAKKLYAWARDAAGNVSLSRVANVTVAAAPVAAAMAKVAAPITAPVATLIPVPANGQMLKFIYAPSELPVVNPDPTQAMPIGIGPVATGGTAVNLDVNLGQFEGPVDVYLTMHVPTGEAGSQAFMAHNFNAATNTFEPIAGAVAPWQPGVMELNAKVWDALPLSDFAPGTYMLTLEVTPAGLRDSSYAWSTYLTIQ